MASLIRVTNEYGKPIVINADTISYIEDDVPLAGRCTVHFVGEQLVVLNTQAQAVVTLTAHHGKRAL